MTLKPLIAFACVALLLGGCKQYAYYQSPFHANTSSYKVMPVDPQKNVAETHVSGALITGASGDRLRDGYWGLNGNLYRSHSMGIFRGFYGVSGALGTYRVRKMASNELYDDFNQNKYPNDSLINTRTGRKFFAGLGGTAGLYVAAPFNDGGEFRLVGVEANYMHEFGGYYHFRDNLPDSAANLNSKSRGLLTIGVHTDLIFDTRKGSDGIKMGGVFNTESLIRYDDDGNPSTILPGYWSITYHYTRERATGFWQVNFGTYTMNLMMGVNYRLGK